MVRRGLGSISPQGEQLPHRGHIVSDTDRVFESDSCLAHSPPTAPVANECAILAAQIDNVTTAGIAERDFEMPPPYGVLGRRHLDVGIARVARSSDHENFQVTDHGMLARQE